MTAVNACAAFEEEVKLKKVRKVKDCFVFG